MISFIPFNVLNRYCLTVLMMCSLIVSEELHEFPINCQSLPTGAGIEIQSVSYSWRAGTAPQWDRPEGKKSGLATIWLGINADGKDGDLIQTIADQLYEPYCTKEKDTDWCFTTSVYHGLEDAMEPGRDITSWNGNLIHVRYQKTTQAWEQIVTDQATGKLLAFQSSSLTQYNTRMTRLSAALELLDGWHPTVKAHRYENVVVKLSRGDREWGKHFFTQNCSVESATVSADGRTWTIPAIHMNQYN